jgi:diketogulonate reductase-like aldo/keto reductase
VEVHPFLLRDELAEYCLAKGIWVEAYSPLAKARKMDDPTLARVAAKHRRSVAQVLIRFSLQKGYITLPKSEDPKRIVDNANVFDFELPLEDVQALNSLDIHLVTGWDPTVSP